MAIEVRATPLSRPPDAPVDAAAEERLLPWAWAAERLTAARTYMVSTARPDGRPHAMPVWGVWVDDAFYFLSEPRSVKAHNLRANARCVISTERAGDAVVLEGHAARIRGAEVPAAAAAVYRAKYQWVFDADGESVHVVRPTVAFGFVEQADFNASATRWTFA
ncbi:MAG: pyridoxamine 5'-phosphate oxidase [Chloroflexi bacterium]|nr:pyridoxamine 5'-phosphate oxidase [Chloroflexota bacterium]